MKTRGAGKGIILFGNNIPLKGMNVKKKISPAPDSVAIGRRIREIRGFELTQEEFARVFGVGQTQWSKYEKGQSLPTVEMLLKLSAYSGKSIDWIVKGG